MAGKTPQSPSLRSLRKEFPMVSFDRFLMILGLVPLGEITINLPVIRELLATEEERARKEQKQEEWWLQEQFEAITASILHRQLVLPSLPSDLDREHASAYLVYGFIFPASPRTFAGSRPISRQSIRRNARNKLLVYFDEDKLNCVERFFLAHGVVRQGPAQTQFSLNIDENGRDVTPEGKRLIAAIKQFMFEHRPQR